MAPLVLVPNLATRWRHLHWLQIWPPDGATCIRCKFGHQMTPLAFNSWLHQIESSSVETCITCITRVATLPWNALLALSVSIEFVYSSARATSVESAKGRIGPQVHLGLIKKGENVRKHTLNRQVEILINVKTRW